MEAKFYIRSIFILFLVGLLFASCRKNEPEPEPVIIGFVTVDLDANKNLIRKKEALIGNFVAEGILETVRLKGYEIDFCLMNSGGIRYNEETRPSAIYPSGNITNGDIDEMLPFGDIAVIVEVTGDQLKEILERSVAQFPEAKGAFVQLSKEIRIVVDTLANEQQINLTGTSIISPGDRIVSIKINDLDYDPIGIYKILVTNFMSEGGDGFVTLRNISASKKVVLTDFISANVKEYIIVNSPITPVLDGRITFQ
jgi:2',3'-cyclic-nucleotide 2'-phosphodiesterase (5'-nucleotidase family)